MMKKFFIIITCFLLFTILIFADKVSAQENHLKYFALLHLLAGDPHHISYSYILPPKIQDPYEKTPANTVLVTFGTVSLLEQSLRTGKKEERAGISLQPLGETLQKMFSQMTDPASKQRRINVALGQLDLFKEGPHLQKFYDYAQSIRNENISEIDKIGEVYAKVAESLRSYGFPSGGGELENALKEGTGVCREKALLLKEGLRKAGIESELIFSENHVWVRVTLSESGELSGFQFDLDPTLYKDAVPLLLRSKTPFSPDEMESLITSSWKPVRKDLLEMIERWKENEKEREKKIAELFSMADEKAKTLNISKEEALKKIVDEKRTALENLAMELGEEAYEKFLVLKLEMERQEREGIYDEKKEWFLLSQLEEELKRIEQEQIESGKRENKADAIMSEIENLLTQAEQAECIEASRILGQKAWKLRPRVEQMSLSAVQQGRLAQIKSREKKIEAKIREEGCLGPSYWYSGLGNFNKWLTIKIIEFIVH